MKIQKILIFMHIHLKGRDTVRCTVLIGEMAKKKVTKEEIAKLPNIHWNSIANKINK